jgi:hypothetical protein
MCFLLNERRKMKKIFLGFLLLTSASANSAEYPEVLVGRYVDEKNTEANACEIPSVIIEKKDRSNEEGAACQPVKVTASGQKFVINEKCQREDSKWTMVSTFELNKSLVIFEKSKYQGDNTLRLTPCVSTKVAQSNSPNPASQKILTCTVNPGQAGVTTFMDQAMKKTGTSPIRDFDGYVFKAEKIVLVNKSEVLVGKLYSSDGKISKGGFADAEEWECK